MQTRQLKLHNYKESELSRLLTESTDLLAPRHQAVGSAAWKQVLTNNLREQMLIRERRSYLE